jgi:hypothetical protein
MNRTTSKNAASRMAWGKFGEWANKANPASVNWLNSIDAHKGLE